MVKASYQGVPGSYGEGATKRLGYEPAPCATFADAAKMAEDGKTDVALLAASSPLA